MKQALRQSLRFRLISLAAVFVLAVSILLTYNYTNTINTIHQETYLAVDTITALYSKDLNEKLRSIESYLISFVNERSKINTIKDNQRNSFAWNSAVWQIQKTLTYDNALYPADGFFFYSPDAALFMTNESTNMVVPKTAILSSFEEGDWALAENKGKWILLSDATSHYLYRAIMVEGCYFGAWIDATAFISTLTADTDIGIFCLIDPEGTLLGISPHTVIPDIDYDDPRGYTFIQVNDTEQMLIFKQIPQINLSLAALIDNEKLEASVQSYLPSAILVIAGIALLLLLCIVAVRQWILAPVNELTAAINEFADGNWRITVKDRQSSSEFRRVNHAFNNMINEIESLKIDVYEKQLSKQAIEMEYLKMQITPHFLINCLNTISQLNDAERNDLAQQMIVELSHHLRYTLSAGPYVTLSLEIENIKNYVNLSNIRYHNSITLQLDIAPATTSLYIIPLLLCNFVENTVKHEVTADSQTVIEITAEWVMREGVHQVHFSIRDNGAGFSPELLEQLSDVDRYAEQNMNRHIGISNVYKRAQQLLGRCEFLFKNHRAGGAQIDIFIPALTKPPGKDKR